jgi:hypothetical protein
MFDQINIECKPSIFLTTLISLPFVSASLLVGSRDIPILMMILAFLIFLRVNLYYINLLCTLKLRSSITHIRLANNKLTLIDKSKQCLNVALSDHSLITPWCCILLLSSNTSKKLKVVLICKPNVKSHDEFRRFRVWTKFGNSITQKPSFI